MALAGSIPLLSAKNFEHMLAESPYKKEIGLQLYTVRNQLADDFEGTLKAIKEAGYFQIEAGNSQQILADGTLFQTQKNQPVILWTK